MADQQPVTSQSTYDTLRLQKPYKEYVLEEQVKGNQPLDFEQWARQNNG